MENKITITLTVPATANDETKSAIAQAIDGLRASIPSGISLTIRERLQKAGSQANVCWMSPTDAQIVLNGNAVETTPESGAYAEVTRTVD